MIELEEGMRKELISQIMAELQTIKGIKFLQFCLDMIRSFKRKWGA